uniref:Pi36 n=1 Tax=Oryza glumipatula TaxID=40148 RepID=A0A0E0AQT6_9ORYZ
MEFVTGAMNSLIPKLGELLKEKYNLHKDLRRKIDSLTKELRRVQAVLHMVGEVPPEQHNELVKLWASDLREASYDMEDIIDTFLVHVDDDGPKPADPHVLRRLGKQVKKLFKKTKHRITIADSIQEMEKKLLEIYARHGRYPVDNIVTLACLTPIDPRILNIEKMAKNLVGIDEPRDELIKMLSLHEHDYNLHMSNRKTKIVYIVGMGGLGKTTLATAVYEKIKVGFPLYAFVPIGQNPDMKKILWNILNRVGQDKYLNCPNMEMLNVQELIGELREFIKGKRFFIVIDDIWDKPSWQILESGLQDNDCGSKVLVTTRKSEVATIVSDMYNMKPLSHDNSRELLYTRTGSEGRYLDSSSTQACDKILKKCVGVPLAIITIASLLASRSGQEWPEVYRAIDFGEEDNYEMANTKRILSFSYYDLPSHLKNCLLYLSMFPEDYEIKKDFLIWMWIAEGFVPEKQNTNIGLYDLGESYFNELINRSMIQPIGVENYGYIYGCRVHDMVLDLARSLTSEQNFVTVLDNDEQRKPESTNARRLALHRTSITSYQFANVDMKKVRSFVATECNTGNNSVAPPGFQVLRVLFLDRCNGMEDYHIKSILQCAGRLCHLRCLQLSSYTEFLRLPKEIGDLKFLKILDLGGCGGTIKELPEELGLLTHLLCLRIAHLLEMVPAGLIGKLTSLQQLDINLAGEVAVRQFAKELGNLRELRMLYADLYNGLRDKSMQRDFLQSLGCLHKVHTMHIYGTTVKEGTRPDAGSVSCPRLWQLSLTCIKFFSLPVWVNSSTLGCLSHLDVKVQVVKEQDMETLGRLPMLCYLKLDSQYTRLVSIKKKLADDGYFQKLRIFRTPRSFVRFDLHGCESISGASIFMPRLESLEFSVDVRFLKDAADLHAGLNNLLAGFNDFGRTSLNRVNAKISCKDALAVEVQEAEVALANAAHGHPNRPVLQTDKDIEKKMRSPDDDEPTSWSDQKVFEISVYPSSNDHHRYLSYLWLLNEKPRLEKLIVNIYVSKDDKVGDVDEAVAAARNVVDHHINHPTLEINRMEEIYCEIDEDIKCNLAAFERALRIVQSTSECPKENLLSEGDRISIYRKELAITIIEYAEGFNVAPKGMADPWMDVRIIKGIIRDVIGGMDTEHIQQGTAALQEQIVNKLLKMFHCNEVARVNIEVSHRCPRSATSEIAHKSAQPPSLLGMS